MIDLNGLKESIYNKAYEAAENKVNSFIDSLQGHYNSMQINDLSMSPDRESKWILSQAKFELEKKDDLSYTITISLPDTATEKQKEIFNNYIADTKKYIFG